jgi:glycerol-3-phosphate dehydrogenase
VDLPIVNEMYKVLFEKKSAIQSIKDLMSRAIGAEMEGMNL